MDETWTLSLIGLGCFAAGFLFLHGPLVCLSLFVGLAFFGWRPIVFSWRGIDIQLGDLIYVLTVVAWAFWRPQPAQARERVEPAGLRAVSTPTFAMLLPILFVTALGVLRVAQRQSDLVEISFISWIRLAQTLSIAWLVPRVVSTARDLDRVLLASEIGSFVAVVLALERAASWGNYLGRWGRVQGFGDPNSLGLVAGYLVARAFFQRDRPPSFRILLAVCGILGLVGARSVSSIVATGLACIVGWLIERRPHIPLALRRTVLTGVVGCGALAAVIVLRPEVAPSAEFFWTSSAAERVIVGAAALELFRRHPFVGVGWQASTTRGGLSSPEVMHTLRRRYRMANPAFFAPRPVTTHNAYLQVLAELGLVGLACFAFVAVRLFRGTRRLVRSARGTLVEAPVIAVVTVSVLVIVWLNQNPIFGGQIETQALAVFLGCLAVLGRLAAAYAEPRQATPQRWM